MKTNYKKNLLVLLTFNFLLLTAFAQTPNAIKYQTVVRDATGAILNNQNVDFQISILETSASGSAIYVETFSETTNQFGLVNIEIGTGTVASGVFASIDWAGDLHFVKVEADIFDGNGLQNMGTSKLLSVPYALNAKTAENVFSGDYNALSNKPILAGDVTGATGTTKVEKIQGLEISTNTPANGQVLKWNSAQSKWIPNDDALGAAGSTDGVVSSMGISGSATKTITLDRTNSLGQLTASFIDSVNDADSDATNELQILNQTGTTVTLSNGGGSISVADNDNDSNNEIQTISKLGSTVTLSDGGGTFTDEVNDADADTTNEIQDLQLTGNTLKITNNTSATNIDLSGYSNLWQENSNDIYYDGGNVGVGVNNPTGKLIVKADAAMDADTAIFEVKNKNGQTIFAVYEEGVRVYVDDSGTKLNSSKAGFAVGGFNATKALTHNYLVVTPDSIRAYIEASSGSGSAKAGFAVGGFNATKTFTHEYLRVTDDSTRIWTEDSIAGFGVRDLNGNGETSYMRLNPNNYFIGQYSGDSLTTGMFNSTYGYATGKNLTSGEANNFIGYKAGYSNTSGMYNNFIGRNAGSDNKKGSMNNFIGDMAGTSNTKGKSNVFIGDMTGASNDTGSYNVFIGSSSGFFNTLGNRNVYIGDSAGYSGFDSHVNVCIGANSGLHNIAHNNTFIGAYAGYENTLGDGNIFLGNSAGMANLTGNSNTLIGSSALAYNQTGKNNTCLGYNAGAGGTSYQFTLSNNDVFIGHYSGFNVQNDSNNTFLGTSTGYSNQYGIGNVFIGYEAGYYEINSNKLYIENTNSNFPLIYGEFDNDIVAINGILGVGTQSPVTNVQIAGTRDVSLTNHGLMVLGDTSSYNIAIDQNEIMARNNNSSSILYLQADGGDLEINTNGIPSVFKDNGDVGIGTNTPGYKLHVIDATPSDDNPAIYGIHSVTDNYGVGVKGVSRYRGVIGEVNSGSGSIAGLYGIATGAGTGTRYGIYAIASGGATSYAGYFQGDVHVNGTLSKNAGTFKIDHPMDPENKYLIHSFVESPDMKNIYDGVIVLDNNGKATVELPEYFETLNENFRYLLTAIGSSAPNIYICKEISNNKFEIAGGNAGQKISWQVTGTRKDPYAKAHPIIVEQEKNTNNKGKYLNPELYKQPKSKGIGFMEEK